MCKLSNKTINNIFNLTIVLSNSSIKKLNISSSYLQTYFLISNIISFFLIRSINFLISFKRSETVISLCETDE